MILVIHLVKIPRIYRNVFWSCIEFYKSEWMVLDKQGWMDDYEVGIDLIISIIGLILGIGART